MQAHHCTDRGCCWDSSVSGVPWCFYGKHIIIINSFIRTPDIIGPRKAYILWLCFIFYTGPLIFQTIHRRFVRDWMLGWTGKIDWYILLNVPLMCRVKCRHIAKPSNVCMVKCGHLASAYDHRGRLWVAVVSKRYRPAIAKVRYRKFRSRLSSRVRVRVRVSISYSYWQL